MKKEAETRLRAFARQVARLRGDAGASAAAVRAVKQFQRDRLARDHADLLQSPRYRLAAIFFLDELYGIKDFSSRDQELARMIPTMGRLLPAAALGAIADAVELDAISEELDAAMAAAFEASAPAGSPLPGLDAARYFDLYRTVGRRDVRTRQIDLVEDIGRQLDKLVSTPFLYRILKGMEGPARLAGLGQMQAFLVSGFEAFKAMRGAEMFVATVAARERALMASAFAGAPSPASGLAAAGGTESAGTEPASAQAPGAPPPAMHESTR
jgi:hypothetical protein